MNSQCCVVAIVRLGLHGNSMLGVGFRLLKVLLGWGVSAPPLPPALLGPNPGALAPLSTPHTPNSLRACAFSDPPVAFTTDFNLRSIVTVMLPPCKVRRVYPAELLGYWNVVCPESNRRAKDFPSANFPSSYKM